MNLDSQQEQTKLYCSHMDRYLSEQDVREIFTTFGVIEELYCFKDPGELFKGSCFIRYQTRKQALRAILYLNQKGKSDNKYSAALVNKSTNIVPEPDSGVFGAATDPRLIDIRFADKKRRESFGHLMQSQINH